MFCFSRTRKYTYSPNIETLYCFLLDCLYVVFEDHFCLLPSFVLPKTYVVLVLKLVTLRFSFSYPPPPGTQTGENCRHTLFLSPNVFFRHELPGEGWEGIWLPQCILFLLPLKFEFWSERVACASGAN